MLHAYSTHHKRPNTRAQIKRNHDLLTHASRGEWDEVDNLLKIGADIAFQDPNHEHGLTVLHFAVIYQNVEFIKKAIEYGADVNVRANYTDDSYMPIHYAANTEKPEIIRILAQHGADLQAKAIGLYINESNDTPSALASFYNITRNLAVLQECIAQAQKSSCCKP